MVFGVISREHCSFTEDHIWSKTWRRQNVRSVPMGGSQGKSVPVVFKEKEDPILAAKVQSCCCCCSLTKSCLTLQPLGLQHARLHCLPEFAQTHVHWISDAIQPSYLLSTPSPPALNFSQHWGLFQWDSSSHHIAKVLELQHQSWVVKVYFL